jgi:hypothetical protein
LGPDGQQVFLSGTWVGAGDPKAPPHPSIYYIQQTNDCITWVGLSAEDGEALGATWVEAFHGTVDTQFEIAGRWEQLFGGRDTPGSEVARGTITVRIEFVPVADGYEVELVLQDSDGDSHHTKRWVRQGAAN